MSTHLLCVAAAVGKCFALINHQISREVARAPHCGLGSDMFNSIASPGSGGTITSHGSARDEESTDDDENASTSSSASSVIVVLATATLNDPLWKSAPSYPPQYLSTTGEYIPPSKKVPDELTAGIVDSDEFNREGHHWASERYENSMHTDHLFDRFNERTAHEPRQCVRCALCVGAVIDHCLM